uniref:Uncharacterized protein n=1 Tax=Arundo donax TaxID=35708 RepID=A0A0A9H9S8_ARUDO
MCTFLLIHHVLFQFIFLTRMFHGNTLHMLVLML